MQEAPTDDRAADERVTALADALAQARTSRVGLEPLTSTHPDLDLPGAYAVQLEGVRRRVAAGERVVGHKVGLSSRAMQRQLGVDSPDLGHLFAGEVLRSGATLQVGALLAPRVEPEIAFVLARALRGPDVSVEQVLAATDHVLPALEIIDSRISDWRIGLVDTVADNASGAGAVLGDTPVPVNGLDLPGVAVQLFLDDELVDSGTGAAVLEHPARAVAWLAGTLSELDGGGLEAGHVVLSGSCTKAFPVHPGTRVRAELSGLGCVELTCT